MLSSARGAVFFLWHLLMGLYCIFTHLHVFQSQPECTTVLSIFSPWYSVSWRWPFNWVAILAVISLLQYLILWNQWDCHMILIGWSYIPMIMLYFNKATLMFVNVRLISFIFTSELNSIAVNSLPLKLTLLKIWLRGCYWKLP